MRVKSIGALLDIAIALLEVFDTATFSTFGSFRFSMLMFISGSSATLTRSRYYFLVSEIIV